ncbi:MAG: VWA domain-containing protein [Planctomycetota bacterium]|jgi:uncharacterized membrane protein
MAALRFQPLLAPWSVLLAAVALGAGVWLYYARWNEGATRRRRLTLGALRAAAFALCILVLAGPSVERERALESRRAVSVLLDVSGSMSRVDGDAPGTKTRLDAAKEALLAVEVMAGQYDARLYSFDDNARFVGRPESAEDITPLLDKLASAGGDTALGDALVRAAPAEPGGAVIVLSDGASNAGTDLETAAAALSGRGVRVFAVPLGRAGAPNVAVTRVLGPRLLLSGEPAALVAEVRFSGGADRPARVSLELDGRVVTSAGATPAAATDLVRLDFTPDRSGDLVYTVKAEPLEGERDTADNSIDRVIRVAAEPLKVLYIEESPRWEYRFIKNAILRDERIEPEMLLVEADRAVAEDADFIRQFPAERKDLFDLDVIVVGDVNPRFFLPRDLVNLRAFISEGGGGLLFVGGERYNPAAYAGGVLGELAPADVDGPPVASREGEALALTEAGAANVALALSTGEPAEFWKRLPPVHWFLDVRPRAGATVLVETAGGGKPVILEQRFGRGRTVLVATDELWRWRQYVGDRYLYRLWVQLVRYLGSRRLSAGAAAGELIVLKDTFAKGETVRATAYLENGLGMPFEEPSVEGFVEDAAGARAAIAFTRAAEMPGLYAAEFPAGSPGTYTLYARGADGYLSGGYSVSGSSLEDLHHAPDRLALEALAEATGGAVLPTDGLDGLAELLPPTVRTATVRETKALWSSYAFLIPIVAALCAEWYLRKRWDLL